MDHLQRRNKIITHLYNILRRFKELTTFNLHISTSGAVLPLPKEREGYRGKAIVLEQGNILFSASLFLSQITLGRPPAIAGRTLKQPCKAARPPANTRRGEDSCQRHVNELQSRLQETSGLPDAAPTSWKTLRQNNPGKPLLCPWPTGMAVEIHVCCFKSLSFE